MKVYLVTTGTYSDHVLRGIFSTREKAEAYRDELRKGDGDVNDIEEWEVDAEAGKRLVPTYKVAMRLDTGEIVWSREDDGLMVPGGPCEVDEHWFATYLNSPQARGIKVTSPISMEHAIKVAAEIRQRWLRGRAAAPTA